MRKEGLPTRSFGPVRIIDKKGIIKVVCKAEEFPVDHKGNIIIESKVEKFEEEASK